MLKFLGVFWTLFYCATLHILAGLYLLLISPLMGVLYITVMIHPTRFVAWLIEGLDVVYILLVAGIVGEIDDDVGEWL